MAVMVMVHECMGCALVVTDCSSRRIKAVQSVGIYTETVFQRRPERFQSTPPVSEQVFQCFSVDIGSVDSGEFQPLWEGRSSA
jgi:hypothetical protein